MCSCIYSVQGGSFVEPFRVSLDRMVPNDICFSYTRITARHECVTSSHYTRDDWNVGYLLCISLEQVMRQFGYLYIIFRSPYENAPPGIIRGDLGAILDNFESHLIPKEYHRDPSHV